ncbi:MAG: tRNA (adenosine(37)-N6)-threonylcarbamoyltransferase complex dimerization subunit type 1 TsaB [Lysobacterales bacterium]|jgi:tRNA threonylcarbamoyladenosine biosynthesis protein TsaB|nr:MAG: tRNA (adenosine(37)-N6)-threonylcarbamoyltransferase complex dimerization subunit type 1 TsaB [Xanthomonadales bacterium]
MSDPVILALEASGEPASVALRLRDGRVLERFSSGEKQSAFLLPAADALLSEAGLGLRDIGLIAVGRGPGGFTGVRFALSVAQGLAYGLGIPTVGISTLAALALDAAHRARASEGEAVLALLDARMGELYGGLLRIGGAGLIEAISEEFLAAPAAIPRRFETSSFRIVAGAAIESDPGLFAWLQGKGVRSMAQARPHAARIAELGLAAWRLGRAGSPASLAPAYLRDKVALTEAERRSEQT